MVSERRAAEEQSRWNWRDLDGRSEGIGKRTVWALERKSKLRENNNLEAAILIL